MKNTNFEMWIADCEKNNVQICPLDYDEQTDIGIYMTKTSYWYHNNQYFNSLVYQLWIGDKRDVCINNYQEVHKKWERLVSESKTR